MYFDSLWGIHMGIGSTKSLILNANSEKTPTNLLLVRRMGEAESIR